MRKIHSQLDNFDDSRLPKDTKITGPSFVNKKLVTDETISSLESGDKLIFSAPGTEIEVHGKLDRIDEGGILVGEWWIDGLEDKVNKYFMGIKYNGPLDIYLEDGVWEKKSQSDDKMTKEAGAIWDAIKSVGGAVGEEISKWVQTYWNQFSVKEKILFPIAVSVAASTGSPAGLVGLYGYLKGSEPKTREKKTEKYLEINNIDPDAELRKQGIDPDAMGEKRMESYAGYNYVEAKKKKKRKKKKDELSPSTFNTDMAFFTETGISPFGLSAPAASENSKMNKEAMTRTFYFGTTSKFFPIIKKHGLRPYSLANREDWTSAITYESAVSLPMTSHLAAIYANHMAHNWGGSPVILKVSIGDSRYLASDTEGMSWKEFAKIHGSALYLQDIAPEDITVYRQSKESVGETGPMKERLDSQFKKAAELVSQGFKEVEPLSRIPYCLYATKVSNGTYKVSDAVASIVKMADDAEEFMHYCSQVKNG
jgi:hypothetical protein